MSSCCNQQLLFLASSALGIMQWVELVDQDPKTDGR